MAKYPKKADFHIHSEYSFDGVLSIDEIIREAKKNRLSWIAITDHNTDEGVRSLWDELDEDYNKPYINVDGLNVVSGVEVTCRVDGVLNNKDRTAKVHLLVYGASLDPRSPFSRLINKKHQNDRDYDFGRLEHLLSQVHNHDITEQDIKDFIQYKKQDNPGYSTLSGSDIYEFLLSHHLTLAKSYKEFARLLEDCPQIERLDIDAKELIEIAHASGGIVIMAHPAESIKRTDAAEDLMATLVENGLDGFETKYNSREDRYKECHRLLVLLDRVYTTAGKKLIFTGGSDSHTFADGVRLGRYQDDFITEESQSYFIKTMKDEPELRLKQGLRHRLGQIPYGEYIDDLVKAYEKTYERIKEGTTDSPVIVQDNTKRTRRRANKLKKQMRDERRRLKREERERLEAADNATSMSEAQSEYERKAYERYIESLEAQYSKANSCANILDK